MNPRWKPSRRLWAVALVGLIGLAARAEEPPPDLTEPPPYDEFLVIPLRVHILQAEDLSEVHCSLTDDDIRRIVGKVNRIWNVAGIHFGVESVLREPAAHQRRFRTARDLQGEAPVGLFSILLPDESRHFDGLHVYYIHEFSVNGIYMGTDFALVKETSRLREVKGGIDEPLPRVTSHELGHALGLDHRQDRFNLLASGTTGTLLNADEGKRARERAREWSGVTTVAELRAAADQAAEAGEIEQARRQWTWLSEIPGGPAEDARRKLAELPEPAETTDEP